MSSKEAASIEAELNPPFSIVRPDSLENPFIFNSPHSGRIYPRSFLEASRLDARALRKSEDCYVEELFADAPHHGAPLMHAHFPRAYLDLNREPYELDPALITDNLPRFANWPTFPQVYVNGELIGGCDITLELFQKGELKPMLEGAAKQSA